MSLDPEHTGFARLIAQHQRSVQGYILATVPSWSDSDEIWQETSVRLWLEFDKFEPGSNFAAWAIRVAHFEILTWRKRATRSRLIFGQELIGCMENQQECFSSRHSEDQLSALDRCLENCSKKQRDMLAQFYESGRHVEQIAESMKCSVDAVYKAVQRTRKSLRRCIDLRFQRTEVSS